MARLLTMTALFALFLINQAFAQQSAPAHPKFNVQMPLPKGPFATWPVESKGAAVAALQIRCGMVAAMGLADYSGPRDAALEWSWAERAICIAGQMPSDWPELVDTQNSARIHAKFAHELDPKLPDEVPAWPKQN